MKTLEIIYPWFMGGVVFIASILVSLALTAKKKFIEEKKMFRESKKN